jgi:protein gp37
VSTKIDWADDVWNPVWGCTHGCPYCYARRFAKRWGKKIAGRDDFVPEWIEKNYWKFWSSRPRRIFVNSMSDVACWEPRWMERVLDRIRTMPEHRFLFLTKRPEAAYGALVRAHVKQDPAKIRLANVWLGASAATEAELVARCRELHMFSLLTPVRFLSIEPLHGYISPAAIPTWINWLIVGAETGNRRGKVVPRREWIMALRRTGLPVFEKASLQGIVRGPLAQQLPRLPGESAPESLTVEPY